MRIRFTEGGYKLGQMILPQLEVGTHGVEAIGMFFFDDNTFVPQRAPLPLTSTVEGIR